MSSNFMQNDLNAFRKAVTTNNKQSIEKHLSHMKDLSQSELNDALFLCIDNFRIDQQTDQCLFLLLRNKANPNYQKNGQTPLIAACKIAQITLVKNLIQNGARPDLCNSEGKHPLQYVLSSRKQNYDVADYLINSMGSVNIEMGKDTALVVSVQKQFVRIFKMLIQKGANLQLNDESILHFIMRRKFKDNNKKKKFIKELSNRWQLTQLKDKNDKLPIDYQVDNQIKNYYCDVFKPKVKSIVEKQHHNNVKSKDKETALLSNAVKQKQTKKKVKEEEQKIVAEEEGVQEQENDQETFTSHIQKQEEKEKIVEVIQEEEDQKKNQEEKQKGRKAPSKILTPNVILNSKKITKATSKAAPEKCLIMEKSFVSEKQKSKKIVTDKKKKQTQLSTKKNKSFTGLIKRVEVEQEKKQDDHKKKTSGRSSYREQDSKKINRKQSDAKLQKIEAKIEEQAYSKNEQSVRASGSSEELSIKKVKSISSAEQQQIKDIVKTIVMTMVGAVTQIFKKVQQKTNAWRDEDESSDEVEKKPQKVKQNDLTLQIINYLIVQEQNHKNSQHRISQVITYLENKMKLCLESHIEHAFSLKIEVYGSQATALSIGQSDLDLLVMTSENPNEIIDMFEVYKIFKEEEIKEVKFIKGARMPVIKLNMNPSMFNFKVDLTFQLREHTGLRCAQLIEQFKAAQPLLKPLVIVLKQIIYAYSLADPYTGGLGSYSLTLMVIALLQFTQIEKKKQNLGQLFLEFLLFYGFQLDYVCQAIIVHPPISGFDYKPFYSIYQLPNTMDLTPKLVLYDPLNPVNNVGRTTYRIECLKNLFRVIYLRMKAEELTIADILDPSFTELINDIQPLF